MIFLLLFTIAAVLGMSFLCSVTEAVLLSLNPLALKVRHQQGNEVDGGWLTMRQKIERPVSAILVFNTLSNTGLATLLGAQFSAVAGDRWLGVFSVILTLLVLFVGELAPKIIGVHHAEVLAPKLITPLRWMLIACHPVVALMERFCHWLQRGEKKKASDPIMDIITLAQAAKAEQVLDSREEIIILHAATLSARSVRTVMVPAEAVKLFTISQSLEANVLAAGDKLHRSYPVSATGSLAEASGYIRVRELFVQNLKRGAGSWDNLIRPVLRVDPGTSLTQLLALFLERREIAALVQDRAGRCVGWITLDDVTQVLMGGRV